MTTIEPVPGQVVEINYQPQKAAHAAPIEIPNRLFFKIGDVAEIAGVKPYVLRYWETEFPSIAPDKKDSGQRVYRKSDVETVLTIKHLLYNERYSIEGARKRLRELRKEGELKEFKKSAVSEELEASRAASRMSPEKAKEMLKVARELHALVSEWG